jgi:hypothetical protein
MVVWAGISAGNTGGRYNPTTDTWLATSITGAPSGVYLHTGVWTGTEMIVWGGYFYTNTGGRLTIPIATTATKTLYYYKKN